MKTFIGIIATLFLLAGIIFGGYLLEWWAAPFVGKLEQRKEVQSGDVRRVSYERFHDLYTDIRSIKNKIGYQQERLEQTEDPDRKAQIRQIIAGLKSQRSDAIEQYNSMANQETVGQFRDIDLPTHISHDDKLPQIPAEPATR